MARPEALPDERAVIERAKAGDARAFEMLYRTYARALYSFVLMPMLGDRDDAEDCLRETFVSAHRALHTFEWQPAGIYPWLKTTAKNKARDLLRASGRRQRLRGAYQVHIDGEEAPRNPGEELAARQSLRVRIEQVLDGMNPRYARALRLRLLEDRSREECASLMEITVNNFDVLLFRSSKAFRVECEKIGLRLGEDI